MRLSRRRRGDAGGEAGRRPEPIHFKVGTTPAVVVVMQYDARGGFFLRDPKVEDGCRAKRGEVRRVLT